MSESASSKSPDQPVIEAFLDTLWVEHGLSENMGCQAGYLHCRLVLRMLVASIY